MWKWRGAGVIAQSEECLLCMPTPLGSVHSPVETGHCDMHLWPQHSGGGIRWSEVRGHPQIHFKFKSTLRTKWDYEGRGKGRVGGRKRGKRAFSNYSKETNLGYNGDQTMTSKSSPTLAWATVRRKAGSSWHTKCIVGLKECGEAFLKRLLITHGRPEHLRMVPSPRILGFATVTCAS